jgi:hypothetical protein
MRTFPHNPSEPNPDIAIDPPITERCHLAIEFERWSPPSSLTDTLNRGIIYFHAVSTKLKSKNFDIGGTGCLRSPHVMRASVILL